MARLMEFNANFKPYNYYSGNIYIIVYSGGSRVLVTDIYSRLLN